MVIHVVFSLTGGYFRVVVMPVVKTPSVTCLLTFHMQCDFLCSLVFLSPWGQGFLSGLPSPGAPEEHPVQADTEQASVRDYLRRSTAQGPREGAPASGLSCP